jgi:hypothetical protein
MVGLTGHEQGDSVLSIALVGEQGDPVLSLALEHGDPVLSLALEHGDPVLSLALLGGLQFLIALHQLALCGHALCAHETWWVSNPGTDGSSESILDVVRPTSSLASCPSRLSPASCPSGLSPMSGTSGLTPVCRSL